MAGRIFLKIRPAMHGFWCHLEAIWCHVGVFGSRTFLAQLWPKFGAGVVYVPPCGHHKSAGGETVHSFWHRICAKFTFWVYSIHPQA